MAIKDTLEEYARPISWGSSIIAGLYIFGGKKILGYDIPDYVIYGILLLGMYAVNLLYKALTTMPIEQVQQQPMQAQQRPRNIIQVQTRPSNPMPRQDAPFSMDFGDLK